MPRAIADRVVKSEFLAEKVRGLLGTQVKGLISSKPPFNQKEIEGIGEFLIKCHLGDIQTSFSIAEPAPHPQTTPVQAKPTAKVQPQQTALCTQSEPPCVRIDVALLQLSFNRGDLLVLAAAVVWALYSSRLRQYPQELHPLAYLTAINIVGLGFIFPLYLHEFGSGKTFTLNPAVVVTILYVAVFASVLAFHLLEPGHPHHGANKAGPFVHLMPVFSTILAVLFLDETLAWNHAQGIFLIFGGILMTTFCLGRSGRT